MVRAMLVAALCAVSSTGCIAIALGNTHSIAVNEQTVDVRVTSHQADVSGQSCFVDHHQRVTSRAQIKQAHDIALFALLEAVVGGIFVVDGHSRSSRNEMVLGAPFLVDGLITAGYIEFHNNSVSTSESWAQSTETAPCVH